MSRELYLYKIERVEDDLPAVINLDEYDYQNPFPYAYKEVAEAADWEKEYGILRKIEYMTVDSWAVAEKLFGEKPNCSSYRGYLGEQLFYKDDKLLGKLTEAELAPYRYKKSFDAYVYLKDNISIVEGWYDTHVEDGFLTYDQLIELAEQIVKNEPDYYSFYGEQVWALMRAAIAAKEGSAIYAVED